MAALGPEQRQRRRGRERRQAAPSEREEQRPAGQRRPLLELPTRGSGDKGGGMTKPKKNEEMNIYIQIYI